MAVRFRRRSPADRSGRSRADDVPRDPVRLRVLHIGTRLRQPPSTEPAAPSLDAPPPSIAPEPPPELDFDAFFRAQYRSVVRLSYSLCGSLSVAEELAQEAFITAHRQWRRVESFDRPDLWVRRVVINRSISHRRRQASERRAFERLRARRREPDQPVVADEAVWQALRELSPRQAQVLALFYVEDQPLSVVAEILQLGEETVKTHLKRGRAALAAKLEEAPGR